MNTETTKEIIKQTLGRIMEAMNLEFQTKIEENSHNGKPVLAVTIQTLDHACFLIGKNGQNLQALEHIIKTVALKDMPDVAHVTVDVNEYKKSRASRVVEVARQAVARVRSTRRAEALMPMSAYERRVVHMELASMTDIATESVGQEPQRRIVIKPYSL